VAAIWLGRKFAIWLGQKLAIAKVRFRQIDFYFFPFHQLRIFFSKMTKFNFGWDRSLPFAKFNFGWDRSLPFAKFNFG